MSVHNHSCKHGPDGSNKKVLTGVQITVEACNTVQSGELPAEWGKTNELC
jgi:hypothetical protein